MTKVALVPGSFDPPTNGHIDMMKRAAGLFDQVIVSISTNSSKSSLFTVAERKAFIEEALSEYSNIQVAIHQDGLTVDFAKEVGANVMVRGLRGMADYEYEAQIAAMNHYQNEQIETVFLMTDKKYQFVSSSIIKEVAKFNGRITDLVPANVVAALKQKLKQD
ncbi:pantetheine-phosphate adenylyltransferase [Isobaculum melis]|uniref:Phosphopantetheine adenylyltransferase n=1 Tax=Isobaculum melis TaxID=142588 RepID=A0A1H9RU81_9LACT|nr:pantetheine-phosphate adenylyltransferase [Isobaculum melis]SER76491.1 Phosphopantetheine adenylyltransferase [Isobaculum melis]